MKDKRTGTHKGCGGQFEVLYDAPKEEWYTYYTCDKHDGCDCGMIEAEEKKLPPNIPPMRCNKCNDEFGSEDQIDCCRQSAHTYDPGTCCGS